MVLPFSGGYCVENTSKDRMKVGGLKDIVENLKMQKCQVQGMVTIDDMEKVPSPSVRNY